MSRSTSRPHRVVLQARAMLIAADGVANAEIARRCEVDADAVRRWRRRFEAEGTEGVGVIAKGRGRKPSLPPGTVAEVLRLTHTERPADTSTHWSTRSMAASVGIGKDAVAKIWADHNLKPWRTETFKVSNDPHFEQKLVDVVGLYSQPASAGGGVLLRREDPVPGAGSHPTLAADEARPGRHDDPRLQTQRHHRPVRRDEPRHRRGPHRPAAKVTPPPTS